MNAPLSHYFIYTGHNSYLTGNQLSSDCSDVPIIKALQLGVRVIELDLWPNSTRDDIDVVHGRCCSGVQSCIALDDYFSSCSDLFLYISDIHGANYIIICFGTFSDIFQDTYCSCLTYPVFEVHKRVCFC